MSRLLRLAPLMPDAPGSLRSLGRKATPRPAGLSPSDTPPRGQSETAEQEPKDTKPASHHQGHDDRAMEPSQTQAEGDAGDDQ